MGKISITPAAMKQGKIYTAGFKSCRISATESKLSKNGQSMNHFVNFLIVKGEDEGGNLRWCCNEKGLDEASGAPGAKIFLEFVKALGVTIDESQGLVFDFEAAKDQNIDVYTQPERDDKGNPINSVTGFRPFSA